MSNTVYFRLVFRALTLLLGLSETQQTFDRPKQLNKLFITQEEIL